MISQNLENPARIGKFKKQAVSRTEFDGLVRSGRARLNDARTAKLSLESRFDLARDFWGCSAYPKCRETIEIPEG
jgi:ssDNA-binding Zn-finger/Zn-ribbon topoisomerase 1